MNDANYIKREHSLVNDSVSIRNYSTCTRKQRAHNGLVAGSSPARPTTTNFSLLRPIGVLPIVPKGTASPGAAGLRAVRNPKKRRAAYCQ
jgi:hypothetical protein